MSIAVHHDFDVQSASAPDFEMYDDEPEFLSIRQEMGAAAFPREELISVVGMLVFLVEATIVCLTLGQLLHWLISPSAMEPERLSLTACHAVAATVMVVARLMTLLLIDRRSMTDFENSTLS